MRASALMAPKRTISPALKNSTMALSEDGAVTATHEDGSTTEFDAVVRIDTPGEADYYRNGGILQYVLRNLMK